MTSDRNQPVDDQQPAPGGTREQQLQDEVLNRPAGEDYNPVPDDVLERNRARFDEVNRTKIRGAGEEADDAGS
jgi:hypothetical protein